MSSNVFDNINVEDEIAEKENTANNNGASFDVESWKQKKRDDVENAFALVDEAAGELNTYDMLHQWLDVRARFDRYSVSNTLLIASQAPDALKLASYKDWQDQGIQVNKGETSLIIFDKIKRYTKADGTTGKQYQTKKVFDIRQTDAKTYPDAVSVDPVIVMRGLVKASPVKLVIDNEANASLGAMYSRDDNMIHVPKMLGEYPKEALLSMLGEITRLRAMGNGYKKIPTPEESKRAAFHAYCVSYIVCRHFGIELQNKKENMYVPTMFADMSPADIRAHLDVISKDANNIIYVIDKARGAIVPKNKDSDAQTNPNNTAKKADTPR